MPVPPAILLRDEPPAHFSAGGNTVRVSPPGDPRRHRPGRPYHPDPRIVIDVVEATGGAGQAALQRTARDAGYWPFRRCYEDGLRQDQGLSGKVSLALSISATGHVEQSEVMASTLGDRVVGACLAREARQIAFLPADADTSAVADVTLGAG